MSQPFMQMAGSLLTPDLFQKTHQDMSLVKPSDVHISFRHKIRMGAARTLFNLIMIQ
jgi:hypothetical protein